VATINPRRGSEAIRHAKGSLFHFPINMKGPAVGLFSWLFSSGDKGDREGAASKEPVSKGKGTRKDGTTYYQDVVRNEENGFRVQVGEKGEERIGYPTADGGYVWKRKG
jgi:hypothetical protein